MIRVVHLLTTFHYCVIADIQAWSGQWRTGVRSTLLDRR